jgi:hypothetical protein
VTGMVKESPLDTFAPVHVFNQLCLDQSEIALKSGRAQDVMHVALTVDCVQGWLPPGSSVLPPGGLGLRF